MEYLVLNLHSAPPGFGLHPEFDIRKLKNAPLSDFFDPLHPDIYLLPNNQCLVGTDEWGDPVQTIFFPFSSLSFCIDLEKESVLKEIWESPTFRRQWRINQLGFLTPYRTHSDGHTYHFEYPQFIDNRGAHSWRPTLMAGVILPRFGFSKEETACFQLAMAHHDHAMPAGGDSMMRIDRQWLSEEKNFAWQLQRTERECLWQELFGFNLEQAHSWVLNQGVLGKLLDILDRISYVIQDCYNFGAAKKGRIRDHLLANPLLGDIWQDIRFTDDRKDVYFADPQRLFDFCYLRALEFSDLLFHPDHRTHDWYAYFCGFELYRKGILNRKLLLENDDRWLVDLLRKHFPDYFGDWITPQIFGWKKFPNHGQALEYCHQRGLNQHHVEQIKMIKTGLDYLVCKNNQIMPLRDAIPKEQAEKLEKVCQEPVGNYVYYFK